MSNPHLIIAADALLYMLTFIYWLKKLRNLNVGLIILAIMTISHIGAFFYYYILEELAIDEEITIVPFLFLYTMILMNLYPLLSYKGVKYVDAGNNEKFIQLFSLLLIVVCIEPLCENVRLFLFSEVEYSELYEDKQDGLLDIYSNVGKVLMRYTQYFNIFSVAVLLYYICKRKNGLIIGGLVLYQINILLGAINTGSRGAVVAQSLILLLTTLFLLPLFGKRTIKKIKKYGMISAIPLFLAISAITVSRYNSGKNDKSIIGWVLLYTSEGPIKFNCEMWNGEHNTNGDVNLCLLKDLLGMKTYITYESRDEHYLAKNGRRIEVFYTYVGDFVSDFGVWGALGVCLLLFIFLRGLLNKSGKIPFHNLLPIIVFLHFLVIGFASNVYRSYFLQKGIFYTSFIYILMMYNYNRGKRKIVDNNTLEDGINSNGNV